MPTGLFQDLFQIEDKGLYTLISCNILNEKSLIKDLIVTIFN